MFERFTDSCRKAMALANQQAQRYHHEYIGTEHILLGLARERESIGPQALHNMGVDIDKLRIVIEKLIKTGPDTVHQGKLPQTPRAKKVVEWAIDEARVLNHHNIGTEHLLLGLLQVEDGIACQVLNSFGITYNKARGEVLRLLGEESMVEETPVDNCSEETDKEKIQALEIIEEFTVCPQCGYDGGFHNIFYGLNSKEQAKWILMCPSCKAKYDIGLRYPE